MGAPLYRIDVSPRATREYWNLAEEARDFLTPVIDRLEKVPRPANSHQIMHEAEEIRRIVVGAYRILYAVYDDARRVLILRIGRRASL